MLHRRRSGTGRPLRATRPGDDGETSSHRTWDRLREMYRLTGQFAGYAKIEDLREEIKLSLPQSSIIKQPRRSSQI